jgi:hypothetical protein
MSLPWFRMYSEFAGDAVIQSLAFEDQRHFVVLLCLKCDGTLDRPMDDRVRDRIICRGLGLDPVTAAEAKRRLQEVGLIDVSWQPSGWRKRQFVSDKSTERVRKYRKNKETGNVPETFQKRSRNGPDTDTDTDTDKPPLPPKGKVFVLPKSVDPAVWAEFEAHRKEIRKPLTDLARTKNASVLALLPREQQRASVDESIRNRWTGVFPPKGLPVPTTSSARFAGDL